MATAPDNEPSKGSFLLLLIVPTAMTGLCVWLAYDAGASLPQLVVTGLTSFASFTAIEQWWTRLGGKPPSKSGRDRVTGSVPASLIQSILSLILASLLALVLWYAGVDRFVSQVLPIVSTIALVAMLLVSYLAITASIGAIRRWVFSRAATRIFVGREENLDYLKQAAKQLHGVHWVQVYGLSGVGKTALAETFFERSAQDPLLHHLQRVRIDLTYPRETRGWAEILNSLRDLKTGTNNQGVTSTKEAIDRFVETTHRYAVIVIDNLVISDDPDNDFRQAFIDILQALRGKQKNVLLITTSHDLPEERLRGGLPADIRRNSINLLNLSGDDVAHWIRKSMRRFEHFQGPDVWERLKHLLGRKSARWDSFARRLAIYKDIDARRLKVRTLREGVPFVIERLLDNPTDAPTGLWAMMTREPDQLVDPDQVCAVDWRHLPPQEQEVLKRFTVMARYVPEWDDDAWKGLAPEDGDGPERLRRELVLANPIVRQSPTGYTIHSYYQQYIYQQVLSPEDRIHYHRVIGKYYASRTDMDAPVLALRHFLDGQDTDGINQVYERAFDRLDTVGDSRQLLELSEHVAPVLAGQEVAHAVVLSFQGRAFRATQQYRPALDAFDRSIAILRADHEDLRLVRALRGQADAYRLLGEYERAVQRYEESRHLAERLADDRGVAKAAYGLARIYRLRGDYLEAAMRYEQARDAFNRLGESDEAWAIFGIGEVARLQWDLDRAARMYKRALEMAEEQRNRELEAYAVWGTGEIHRLNEQHDLARADYQRSRDLCQELEDLRSEAWALMGLAEISRMAHKPREALSLYQTAQSMVKEPVERAHASLGGAAAKRLLGEARLQDYESAFDTYQHLGMQYCIVQTLIDRALCPEGDRERIQHDLETALAICQDKGYTHERDLIDQYKIRQGKNDIHPLNYP
jgi:tetratricopeptide (TPR) repeat protein